jgi:hypothetical protein
VEELCRNKSIICQPVILEDLEVAGAAAAGFFLFPYTIQELDVGWLTAGSAGIILQKKDKKIKIQQQIYNAITM